MTVAAVTHCRAVINLGSFAGRDCPWFDQPEKTDFFLAIPVNQQAISTAQLANSAIEMVIWAAEIPVSVIEIGSWAADFAMWRL